MKHYKRKIIDANDKVSTVLNDALGVALVTATAMALMGCEPDDTIQRNHLAQAEVFADILDASCF